MAAKKKAVAKRPANRTRQSSANSQAKDDTQDNKPATTQEPQDNQGKDSSAQATSQPDGDGQAQNNPADQGASQQDDQAIQDPEAEAKEDTQDTSKAGGNDQELDNPADQGASQQDGQAVQDPDAEALEVMTRSADGFFRAGWKWGRKARKVALVNFNEDQIRALKDEPELIVRHCKMGD